METIERERERRGKINCGNGNAVLYIQIVWTIGGIFVVIDVLVVVIVVVVAVFICVYTISLCLRPTSMKCIALKSTKGKSF